MDIENVVPAGGSEAGKTQEDEATKLNSTENDEPVTPAGPPPTNKERADAKAAKEAEEAAAEEKRKAEEASAENTDGEEGEEEDKELDTSVWGDTGDEVANSVLATLQNSGVSTEDAKALLWDAVEAGDPSKVDRDALVEKVGKAKATLIMAGIENVTSRNNERLAEVVKTATEAAGGADNWAKARDWATKSLSEDQLNEYRDMLDAGGEKAKYAASQIVSKYNADPKNTALTAGDSTITPDAKSGSTVEPITRRQYGELLDRAHRRGASQAEFNALRAQRQAGIKKGI